MQFLDCKITLSFSNQKNKDRSETLINKGKYEVKLINHCKKMPLVDTTYGIFLYICIVQIVKRKL